MSAELATSLTATEAERLEQAESLVRGFCGWHIAPSREDVTTILRGNGTGTLALPSLHVTEVASVTSDETLLTVEDDYTWSSAGVITTGGCFPRTTVVTVVYTHGYPFVPPEITAVVQAIAQRAVNNPGGVVTSRGIGPFSESYGSLANGTALSLFDSEIEVLRRYRIPVVA